MEPPGPLHFEHLAMSDLSREELIEALTKAGVEVPRKWTKIEMQLRLEQITGQDMAEKVKPKAAKEKSQYQQQMVTKLNQASRRKNLLVEFVEKELRMTNMSGYTIDRIKMMAMRRIYDLVPAHSSDALGFGKYSASTYEEVWTTDPGYCTWAKNTVAEPNSTCDPRLIRFAPWLVQQDEMELKPTTPAATESLKRGRKKTETGEKAPETEILQALMTQVTELKNEVREMRQGGYQSTTPGSPTPAVPTKDQ